MNKIRAIGFDYAGVIGGSDVVGKSFTSMVSDYLDMEVEDYRKVYFSINHLLNTQEKTPREFWEIFLDKVGMPEKIDGILNIWDEFENRLLSISPRMIGLVDKLRQSGYKVGLLSNATTEFGRKLRDRQLEIHFDVFMISGDVGLMKPDPAIFKLFMDQLGVTPEEFVFIDDAKPSLSTAQECGFSPILFTSYEELLVALSDLDIILNYN